MTYVAPVVTATGLAKLASCHPVADSPLNVALESRFPDDDHR